MLNEAELEKAIDDFLERKAKQYPWLKRRPSPLGTLLINIAKRRKHA